MTDQSNGFLSRRGFLVAAGAAGIAAAAAGGLAGCSSALKQTSASTAGTGGAGGKGGTIKIGFVSPQTGQLAVFTQSNGYVLGQVRSALEGRVALAAPVPAVRRDQVVAAYFGEGVSRGATT